MQYLKDMDNLSESGKEKVANLGMPSDTYTDLTFIKQSLYTAPANGYILIDKKGSNTADNNRYYLYGANYGQNYTGSTGDVANAIDTFSANGTGTNALTGCLKVKKNDKYAFESNSIGDVRCCRFVYAEGDV